MVKVDEEGDITSEAKKFIVKTYEIATEKRLL